MKIPMQWIAQYTKIPLSAAQYEREMIMHGTGVEGVEDQNEAVQNVVVGRILSVKKHENSDHMVICQVDVGEAEPLQIVTGAPNVQEGILVPVAKVGAILPGGKRIQAGKLRGVDSFGMCCSGPELGVPEGLYPSVGDKGLLVFHEEIEPGTDVRTVLGIDQTIVDFEILANRPDCLSVWGIARETAGTLGTPFCKPTIEYPTVPGTVQDYVSIQVQDAERCPRYCGRVITNVRLGPSPMWMRKALHAAGVRPINNIVDITNYVMLETGHPMHAFDLQKVKGRQILVRPAAPGETIVTLDGKERALSSDMLMIADGVCATGIAGIMGGEESEITAETREVLFEIAAFDRASIRTTSRALGLRTESSGRFERGVCAATCAEAADRACQLVAMLDAGDVVEGAYDFYPHARERRAIPTSLDYIRRRTGVDIPLEDAVRVLRGLGMEVEVDGERMSVLAPVDREDMENEADVSEEVLRIYGYDHIPSTCLRGETSPGGRNPAMIVADRVSELLVGKGAYETRAFSFISPKWIEKLGLEEGDPRKAPIAIRNPLGEDTSVLRTSLIPSMLNTLALNQNRKNDRALLYEIAPVYESVQGEELPHERPTLCIGAYGPDVDFYLMRDIVLDLLGQFGLQAEIVRDAAPYHHPGRAAALLVNGEQIAMIGEVHPDAAIAFEMSQRSVVAEVDLERIGQSARRIDRIATYSDFPAVTRDLALVMEETVLVGDVAVQIRRSGGALLREAVVFDIYRGAPMRPGSKSVAYTLRFRSDERTLSDEDVNPLMERILADCQTAYGATLRA